MSGTDRSLVPWNDRRIKYQQQESFTWTPPTIPQFNLTKIEHNRLTVRCLLRAISYEKSVFDHTTDLHEISCSNPRVMMSRQRHHHLNTGIWLVAASQRSADDPPATAVEELLKCTSIDDTTMKRRLKTSDSQLSQSHSSIIYFILNWDRLLV